MAPTGQPKSTITKEEAIQSIRDIIGEKESSFVLVPFKKFQTSYHGAHLKSKQYEVYLVLCHANSSFHAGWFVCPFFLSGFCPIAKGIMLIDTKKGGTNKFGGHISEHQRDAGKQTFMSQNLDIRCRKNISRAAAMAVILDLRPIGFTDNHPGIASFAEAVFKAGQSVPSGITINPKSYLPSKYAVTSALTEIGCELRSKFKNVLEKKLIGLGGAVTVDGVSLKLQRRHYYDFTFHHIHVIPSKTVIGNPEFEIKTTTALFLEGPEVPNAQNISSMLENNLQKDYGVEFNSIGKNFTLVTDGAAVMARMAGSSISTRIATPDQKWMRWFVHVLNNCMKAVMDSCAGEELLQKIVADFKFMKRIVEDSRLYCRLKYFSYYYLLEQLQQLQLNLH